MSSFPEVLLLSIVKFYEVQVRILLSEKVNWKMHCSHNLFSLPNTQTSNKEWGNSRQYNTIFLYLARDVFFFFFFFSPPSHVINHQYHTSTLAPKTRWSQSSSSKLELTSWRCQRHQSIASPINPCLLTSPRSHGAGGCGGSFHQPHAKATPWSLKSMSAPEKLPLAELYWQWSSAASQPILPMMLSH